jgi:hypothetical protein
MSCKREFAVAFVLLSCLIAGHTFANDSKLTGTLSGNYRFTANGACVEATGGFGPLPTLEALGDTVVYNEFLTGTVVFDGVGGALQSHIGTTMFNGPWFPLNSPVGTFISTCTYTYAVSSDLSFTMDGSCSSGLPIGPVPGQTATVTGIKLMGYVSRDGNTVLISGVEPSVQDLVLSGGYSAKRLCSSSGTYFKAGR